MTAKDAHLGAVERHDFMPSFCGDFRCHWCGDYEENHSGYWPAKVVDLSGPIALDPSGVPVIQ